jgi:hypothetical protein
MFYTERRIRTNPDMNIRALDAWRVDSEIAKTVRLQLSLILRELPDIKLAHSLVVH